ncbi:MAG: aminoacyl-tRNA hydrolase [Acidobacteria bacterium]|nr:MAG: aminoacyl-tRNA hydrolase [Acidobacteriota bacterium]
MKDEIQLVVGLGNPGPEYEGSRHNIGFAVVEALAQRYSGGDWRTESTHREVVAEINGRPVVLACPSTFMNRSGQAVGALCERLALTPHEVLVVVDDIDLRLGRMRIRPQGGPGTHNGLRDISQAVGDAYPRLRVGVGGADAGIDLAAYVLSPFPDAESAMVERVVEQAVAAVEVAVTEGVGPAMNRFNGSIVDVPQVEDPAAGKIWDLGSLTPTRTAEWCVVEDVVIVECPKPGGRGPKYWGAWCRWWTGPQRIRLDAVGSSAWLRIDGATTLGGIVDVLGAEMPDDRDLLVARLDLFVRTLASQGLLRLGR